jgi:L-alanine-DL-glutamate epimerase-like enolase superfamily enzyme
VLNDDSTIDVPNGHGLGVTINEDALKRFTLSEITLKAE